MRKYLKSFSQVEFTQERVVEMSNNLYFVQHFEMGSVLRRTMVRSIDSIGEDVKSTLNGKISSLKKSIEQELFFVVLIVNLKVVSREGTNIFAE